MERGWKIPAPAPALSLSPGANGHRAWGASPRAASGFIGNVWKSNPHLEAPLLLAASMGSCLSSPQPASPPLAQERPALWPPGLTRAQDGAHRGPRVSTGPFPQMPPDWRSPKPGREVMETPRRLRAQSPPETAGGPERSGRWGLWRVQHPRRLSSPVTIQITPPERQGRPCAPPERGAQAAGSPPTEDPPDPVAKETVLRTPSWARKGTRKLDGPLWFEIQGRKIQTRDLEPWPSPFQAPVGTGAGPCCAPRPGPLSRSRCPWSYNVRLEDLARGRTARPLATAPGQGAEPPPDT
ncbi:POM121-like protein 12 [Eptesicus fuscus]|uniref:POM121-like protein 12 n=1 Tax=Eptesicus fuscus TaxID=29078 RepID=UPI0024040BBF|nr:POM121-like protein 12 [Eptesicus fuscus]